MSLRSVLAGLASGVLLSGLLAGCATVSGPVATSGSTEFTFTAPGGRTHISYDPPENRGQVRGLSGEDLLEPGRTIGLQDYAGQVVVLNIWGAWCGRCREEMPALHQIHEQKPVTTAPSRPCWRSSGSTSSAMAANTTPAAK